MVFMIIASCLGAYFLSLQPAQAAFHGGPNHSSNLMTLLVILPFFAWRVLRRFRKMVGRQRLSKARPWITVVLYPSLILLLALTLTHPYLLGWLVGGVVLGCGLGVFGLKKTQFEPTPTGLYYTPHAHIGMALLLLFVVRVGYRLIKLYAFESSGSNNEFARSPLTLAMFGLLAGYYVTYAVGLIQWRFRVIKAKQQREAARGIT